MSLQWIGQDDFGAGTLLGIAQDTEIGVGVEQMLNGIIDDAGDIVRRGPVTRLGAAAVGAPLTFVWSGYLGINYVELVATAAKMYAVIADAFVDLGAPGLDGPVLPAIVGDLVVLPNGFVWGGSTKAVVNAGTVSQTAGSPVITGAATGWSAATVEAGMLYQRTGGGVARIKSFDSATQITLDQPVTTTLAAQAYTISRSSITALPTTNRVRHLATAANRLLIATDNVVAFSSPGTPFMFSATDFHRLPDGVQIQGMSGLRDQVLVFTNYGLWAIGGMAFDLTDDFGNPQQTLNRLTPEISLLHEAGIAEWSGALIAPCIDRVFIIDGLSPPVPISASISGLYMTYVRLGYKPGGAKVFRNGYFLPILDTGKVPVALLGCRLDRPVRSRQVWYPWSEYGGYPVGISAIDVDLRAQPVLRGVHKDGWRVNLTGTMPPFTGSTQVVDGDGTIPVFDVQTRDFATGDHRQPNHFRRLRLWYSAQGVGEVQIGYSFGDQAQRYQDVKDTGRLYSDVKADYATYDSLLRGFSTDPADVAWSGASRFWNVLSKQVLKTPGVDPLLWNMPSAERQRYVRVRVRSTDGIGQLKIRKIDVAIRPTTHQR